ncbi:MAG: BrnT family toxin [Chloroflexi bacterium]|nr:BrnT family toxin [Dehalococcoidia bacterium]MCO5202487.1 BrnT family toxin [Chloroflexota bacterium]NJD64752.1 BrnT family toxin [Chloroflexota bacterium]PWB41782.1 MAG: hypothetical protein C3F10_14420 [Dehalococcoidia bacterium]
MDILYDLQHLRFEWDAEKASANLVKHGVDFFDAAEVFLDPLAIAGDASGDDGEGREWLLGETYRLRLLIVVHTERGDRARIISARPATRHERRTYEGFDGGR